jgi:hypothetical protein
MTERWAVIQHGSNVVDNIALWDGESEWTVSPDCYVVFAGDQRCSPSWMYDSATHTFLPPPPPPPPTPIEPPVPTPPEP